MTTPSNDIVMITSRTTKFYKRVFPALWFGFLALFVVDILMGPVENAIFVVVPIAMGVLGFVLMRNLVWDLVDEVYDIGDYLVVNNRGEQDTIPFSNIMKVSSFTSMHPPRITLRLEHPCKFGSEITFSPAAKLTLNPLPQNQIAEDLIVRVNQAHPADDRKVATPPMLPKGSPVNTGEPGTFEAENIR
jgi:hypothetical protein